MIKPVSIEVKILMLEQFSGQRFMKAYGVFLHNRDANTIFNAHLRTNSDHRKLLRRCVKMEGYNMFLHGMSAILTVLRIQLIVLSLIPAWHIDCWFNYEVFLSCFHTS
jgi:hypothetical protein